jgi:hypothetical protein
MQGNEIIVSAYVALPADTIVFPSSQITLPDGEHPKITSLRKVERPSDHQTEFIRVILGNPSNSSELV